MSTFMFHVSFFPCEIWFIDSWNKLRITFSNISRCSSLNRYFFNRFDHKTKHLKIILLKHYLEIFIYILCKYNVRKISLVCITSIRSLTTLKRDSFWHVADYMVCFYVKTKSRLHTGLLHILYFTNSIRNVSITLYFSSGTLVSAVFFTLDIGHIKTAWWTFYHIFIGYA